MKTWTVEEIKNLMATNDKFIGMAVVQIYNCQTESEKYCKETEENNGVGFNGVDANILSSFAEFYKERGYLSQKQMQIARKKMVKYAKQVTKLANEHEQRKGA